MEELSPMDSSKGSQELFGLSPKPLESRQKEADATASRPTLKAFTTEPEERAANTEWPALPFTSPKGTKETAHSTIPFQPGQRSTETPSPTVTPASWKANQKTPGGY